VDLERQFGRSARVARLALDVTQQSVADAAGISRSFLARIEGGRGNPSLRVVERIADALGQRVELSVTLPVFLATPIHRDLVHARCVAAIGRRLTAAGWLITREVDVSDGRFHGWIDLLAYHPVTRTLLVIEVKAQLLDIGAMQRQVGWYERRALAAGRSQGWTPRSSMTWLVGLASDELDRAINAERDLFAVEFPGRAADMLRVVAGSPGRGRAVALVDPASKRRDWLIRTRCDGRRTALPYRDYADAARRPAR
jgi:transcriptional regulator with XRE-family HTH domain